MHLTFFSMLLPFSYFSSHIPVLLYFPSSYLPEIFAANISGVLISGDLRIVLIKAYGAYFCDRI